MIAALYIRGVNMQECVCDCIKGGSEREREQESKGWGVWGSEAISDVYLCGNKSRHLFRCVTNR